jgi:hypothetical protein
MKLRCTNRECFEENDQHMFSLSNVTVDEDGEVTENIKKIEAEYFTCCFCFAEASWEEE